MQRLQRQNDDLFRRTQMKTLLKCMWRERMCTAKLYEGHSKRVSLYTSALNKNIMQCHTVYFCLTCDTPAPFVQGTKR